MVRLGRGRAEVQPAISGEQRGFDAFSGVMPEQEAIDGLIERHGRAYALSGLDATDIRRQLELEPTTPEGHRVLAPSLKTTQWLPYVVPMLREQMNMQGANHGEEYELSGRIASKELTVVRSYVAGEKETHQETWSFVDKDWMPGKYEYEAKVQQYDRAVEEAKRRSHTNGTPLAQELPTEYVEHYRDRLDGSFAIFRVDRSVPNPYDSSMDGEIRLVDVVRADDANPRSGIVVFRNGKGEQESHMLSGAGDTEYNKLLAEFGNNAAMLDTFIDELIQVGADVLNPKINFDPKKDIVPPRYNANKAIRAKVRSTIEECTYDLEADASALAGLFRASRQYKKLSEFTNERTVMQKGQRVVPPGVAQTVRARMMAIRQEVSQSISDVRNRRDLITEARKYGLPFEPMRCRMGIVDEAERTYLNIVARKRPDVAAIRDTVAEYNNPNSLKDAVFFALGTDSLDRNDPRFNNLAVKFGFDEQSSLGKMLPVLPEVEAITFTAKGAYADDVARSIYEGDSYSNGVAMRGISGVMTIKQGELQGTPLEDKHDDTYIIVDLLKAPACLLRNIDELFDSRRQIYGGARNGVSQEKRTLRNLLKPSGPSRIVALKTVDGVTTYEGEVEQNGALGIIRKKNGEIRLAQGKLEGVYESILDVGDTAVKGALSFLPSLRTRKTEAPDLTGTNLRFAGLDTGDELIADVVFTQKAVCAYDKQGDTSSRPMIVMQSSQDPGHNPRLLQRAKRVAQ